MKSTFWKLDYMTVLTLLFVQESNALWFKGPDKPNFVFPSSVYPPVDKIPTTNPFNTKYDFSRVPNIPVNLPLAYVGAPPCRNTTRGPVVGNVIDPVTNVTTFDQATFGPTGSCAWSCGGCIRDDVVNTCPSEKQWGITFDDGPSRFTPDLLDYLLEHNIKATFFCIGSRVVEFGPTVLRAFQEGHQIGVHTWSHRALTTLTNDQIIAELEYTAMAITQVIGTRPIWIRPPFGDMDDRVRAIATAMGFKIAIWDFDSGDFSMAYNANFYGPNVLENLFRDRAVQQESRSSGLISLQHDLYENTAKRAPGMIDQILKTSNIPMTVGECIGDLRPYQDQSLVLPLSLKTKTGSAKGTTTGSNAISTFSHLTTLFFVLFWTLLV